MRILFLSNWFPYPPSNGSRLRIYSLLRGLARHHEITLLSFSEKPEIDNQSPEIHSICQAVYIVPIKSFNSNSIRAIFGFFSPTPRFISETFSVEMAHQINEILSSDQYNLVIASQLSTAIYRPYFQNYPAIFEEVEVGLFYGNFNQARSSKEKVRNGLTWVKYRNYLANLLKDFQLCTVVSEQEKQLISRVAPDFDTVEVIPNFIYPGNYNDNDTNPQSDHLIFTGPFRYPANHDAMVWFLDEIYPLIQSQVPEVHLTITGDHDNLPLPAASKVTLTGFVEDINPLIKSAKVNLVPIREGGGTRIKILEAMALGVPVVSTSKGAEGLEVFHGEHLLIADSAQGFAENVVRLLKDSELRNELIVRARNLVKTKYDMEAVIPQFEDLVQRVAQ